MRMYSIKHFQKSNQTEIAHLIENKPKTEFEGTTLDNKFLFFRIKILQKKDILYPYFPL